MSLWDVPVRDLRSVVTEERARLIHFMDSLTEEEWIAPSAAPGWTVRDLALHLLHGDLRWLSSRRDGELAGLVEMLDRAEFAQLLAAKNQQWVDAAKSLSRRVVTDLLGWAGGQVDVHEASQDLLSEGWVSWASDDAVPYWFNVAQEFTERWIHQQQMREAVGRVDDHEALLPEVLRTFVWAYPHQLRVVAEAGRQVELSIDDVGVWTLTSQGDGHWLLAGQPASGDVAARMSMAADTTWRSLTGAPVPAGSVRVDGPATITQALLRVRGIIV